uniref:Uncharacterized protein n=1 Tax=Magallana gigas TaxID=29159 RepID=A0A8W8MCN3_MAGGI|nr:uncharacterized protein LOC105328753 isoform X1 [Crassostrea gigas]XP_034315181.1 uncharacterized protein LOC105328753 isoform X1 [Crassostrea gigas]XP_034315182.1 uncharacterized protein LOC105328753 isoform X1 [Crassostrea gigas]
MAPAVSTVVMVGLTFVVKISLVYSTSGSGICSKDGEPPTCCADYRKSGDKCVECVGFYGHQCTSPCSPGFYGFGCRLNCSCIPCNNINGSCDDVQITQQRPHTEAPSWLIFLLSLIFVSGCFAVVITIIILKKRSAISRTVNTNPETPKQGYDVGDKDVNDIEMSYDDVRESQMILDEIHHLPRTSTGTLSRTSFNTDIYNVAVHNYRMKDSIYA